VEMLVSRLDPRPQDLTPFYALARRLGEWPLLLGLVNAALRYRLTRDETLEGALDYLNEALDRRGMTAFDHRQAKERNQAVAKTIEVSLDLLSEEERWRYMELVIFPEDVEIPLTTVGALWGLEEFDARELVEMLDNFSLLKFNLQTGTIRLHDVFRAYLAGQLANAASVHARLVDAWGDPAALPDPYAWRWLGYHLVQAGRQGEFRKLLLDFPWLQAKLEVTDANALIADYDFFADGEDLHLVQGAIRLSAHILANDKTQLAGQLLGRVLSLP